MTVLMLHRKKVNDKLKHYYGYKITIILASLIYSVKQLALLPVMFMAQYGTKYSDMKRKMLKCNFRCALHVVTSNYVLSVEFKRRPESFESDRRESETTLRSRTSTEPSAPTRSTPTPGSAPWTRLWTAVWTWAITPVRSVRRAPETRPCP